MASKLEFSSHDVRDMRVVLTSSCFTIHIQPNHDITVDEIRRCISEPTSITIRPDEPNRHLYYKRGFWGGVARERCAKVVVETGKNPAEVVTAFYTSNPDMRRELQIWPTP